VKSLSRRRLLAAGGTAALATGVLAQVASAQADKPRRSPWDLSFDVDMQPPTAAPAAAGAPPAGAMAAGPFFLTGNVFPGGALTGGSPASGMAPVGTLRVWGWTFDPTRPGPSGSVASASLELTGRGQIILGGTTVAGKVAILAGTGEFRGSNGQADYVALGPNGARIILDYSEPYAGT